MIASLAEMLSQLSAGMIPSESSSSLKSYQTIRVGACAIASVKVKSFAFYTKDICKLKRTYSLI